MSCNIFKDRVLPIEGSIQILYTRMLWKMWLVEFKKTRTPFCSVATVFNENYLLTASAWFIKPSRV